jgi:NAD(P)-dependent dehydrogenase (short-subunit alcohol dehydrogenase family)
MLLEGKSVVVTGGNSGIGKAIVLAATAEGANVVVDYRMHPENAAEVIAVAARAGGCAVGVEADVSRTEELHRVIQAAVANFGRLDVLVSNAGIEIAGVELGSLGIRFVNLAPGAVSTPINAATEMDPELLKQLNGAIPLGRIAQAAEIADGVVFLASDKARYVNATTVTVDGGLSQSGVGL